MGLFPASYLGLPLCPGYANKGGLEPGGGKGGKRTLLLESEESLLVGESQS